MKTTRAIYITIFCVCLLIIAGLCAYEITTTGTLSKRAIASTVGIGLASLIFLAKGLLRTKGAKTDLRAYEDMHKKHIERAFTRPGQEKNRTALLMGIDYFTTHQYNKGIKHLERLLKKCESTWDLCAVELFLAKCYYKIGATNKAIELYEDMIRRDPLRATAWSNLGYIYIDLGDSKKALDCLSKAVQADPENPHAFVNMAVALINIGGYDYALPYALKALELKTNMVEASNAVAVCYIAMGDYESAERYFKISVRNGASAGELRQALELHKDCFVPYEEDKEAVENEAEE